MMQHLYKLINERKKCSTHSDHRRACRNDSAMQTQGKQTLTQRGTIPHTRTYQRR